MTNKKFGFWRGIPVEKMTREQLIEALEGLYARYCELMTLEEIRARSLGKVEMVKRGER